MATYSITLDDLDLALLPARSRTNDFLKQEYFQFQVVESEQDEVPPTYINYTCHVCAIDVPAAFSEEHIASKKHRANVRIMTAMAQRMRGLITALPPPQTPRPAATFCDSCATVVDKGHDNTPEHKLAVKEDKLLCLLSTCFGDDDDLVDEKISRVDKVDDSVTNKDTKRSDVNDAAISNTVKAYVADHDDGEEEIGNKQQKDSSRFVSNEDVSKVRGDDKGKKNQSGKEDSNTAVSNTAKSNSVNALKTEESVEVEKKITSVDYEKGSKIYPYVEVKGKKHDKNESNDGKNDVNSLAKPETEENNTNRSKTQRDAVEIEIEPSGDEKLTDLNDPQHNFFWAVVKRYKLNANTKTVTIKPADDKIQIVVDNEKLNVSYDNFHSLDRLVLNVGLLTCRVCNVTFGPENESNHISSDHHLERTMLPVTDSHCYRMMSKHWSHCILCNVVVLTKGDHKEMQTHCYRRKQAILQGQTTGTHLHTEGRVNKDQQTNAARSSDGNIKTVLREERDRPKVVVEAQQQKTTPVKRDSINQPTPPVISHVTAYPFAATENSGEVFCVICECIVPNHLSNRVGHLKGRKHLGNCAKR